MVKNIRVSLVLLLLCGIAYPLAMTGLSQWLFPVKAEGSLMKDEDGNLIGSELIGQTFHQPNYFFGRVSSINNDASSSGSANYAPSNEEMIERTRKDLNTFLAENPDIEMQDIPADLLTNSGSGLDPHISPQAAEIQVPRIAEERGLSEETVYELVDEYTEDRSLALFGEPRVNVLKINIALDQLE